MPGFKYNMTDLQAALGIHQLASIESRLARREQVWRRYDQALADLPIIRPTSAEGTDRHARHLYTILVDDTRCRSAAEIRCRLLLYERGVATSIHFAPVHLQPFYRQAFGFRRGLCPSAEMIAGRTLSLPLYPAMTDADVSSVCRAVRAIVEQERR